MNSQIKGLHPAGCNPFYYCQSGCAATADWNNINQELSCGTNKECNGFGECVDVSQECECPEDPLHGGYALSNCNTSTGIGTCTLECDSGYYVDGDRCEPSNICLFECWTGYTSSTYPTCDDVATADFDLLEKDLDEGGEPCIIAGAAGSCDGSGNCVETHDCAAYECADDSQWHNHSTYYCSGTCPESLSGVMYAVGAIECISEDSAWPDDDICKNASACTPEDGYLVWGQWVCDGETALEEISFWNKLMTTLIGKALPSTLDFRTRESTGCVPPVCGGNDCSTATTETDYCELGEDCTGGRCVTP